MPRDLRYRPGARDLGVNPYGGLSAIDVHRVDRRGRYFARVSGGRYAAVEFMERT